MEKECLNYEMNFLGNPFLDNENEYNNYNSYLDDEDNENNNNNNISTNSLKLKNKNEEFPYYFYNCDLINQYEELQLSNIKKYIKIFR